MLRIGDIVRFLNDIGGGRVVAIKGSLITVEDEDGFQIPMPERECVLVESATVKNVELKTGEKKFEKEISTKSGDILDVVLAYIPSSDKMETFDVYLINESNYSVYVQYITNTEKEYFTRFSGEQRPYSREKLFTLNKTMLNESNRRFIVRILPYKERKGFTIKPYYELTPTLDPKVLVRSSSYKENEYIDQPAFIIPLINEDKSAEYNIEESLVKELMNKNRPSPASHHKKDKKDDFERNSEGIIEYDLHAAEIIDNLNNLSNAEILKYQLNYFREKMKLFYGKRHGEKVVFIHGKGDGVLRQEVLKTLKKEYPKCRYQDASFREYGFGATMVLF